MSEEEKLGMSGLALKILDQEQQDAGEMLLDPDVKKEVVDLSMVGIIENGTRKGGIGVVFVFQRQGIPEYFVAPITEGLLEMVHGGLTGARKRFKDNKDAKTV